MRIVLVNDFFSPFMVGGAESVIRSLSIGFQEHGHSVFIITARIQGTKREEVFEGIHIYRIGDFPEIRKSTRLASGTLPTNSPHKMVVEFQELLQKISPDVVHFHNVWLLGPKLLTVNGYRKVVTFHDYWPFCLRRSMIRVDEKPCIGPGKISCRLCQLRAPASFSGLDVFHTEQYQRNILDYLSTCNFFTAPSQYVAQEITKFSGLKVQVLHNSLATSAAIIERGSDKTSSYVLYASRATRIKGYDLILAAFTHQDLKDYCLKVASNASMNLQQNVQVLSWQSSEDVMRLISNATCVVVPSLWPENSPMLILEALSLGIPVIASRIGGIPELIEEGKTGLLITPGDVKGFVAGIKRCFEDESLKISARKFGPEFVEKNFSKERIVTNWETLYVS